MGSERNKDREAQTRRGSGWPAVLWCPVSRSNRRGDQRGDSRCLYRPGLPRDQFSGPWLSEREFRRFWRSSTTPGKIFCGCFWVFLRIFFARKREKFFLVFFWCFFLVFLFFLVFFWCFSRVARNFFWVYFPHYAKQSREFPLCWLFSTAEARTINSSSPL